LLDAIEVEYDAYLARQPYTAVHDPQLDAGRIITRLRIDTPVPDRLSVLFGEVVHQARSALDHLVCRLLEARNRPITARSGFPVMTTEEAWRKRIECPVNAAGASIGGPLAGLDPGGAARRFIYGEQPLHADDPAAHPLAQLNLLWNLDKHRNLNAANSYTDPRNVLDAFAWTPRVLRPVAARVPVRPLRPLKTGDVLAVFNFPPRAMPDSFAMSGPVNFEIAFGPDDGKPRPRMRDTVGWVAALVNRAEPLIDAD
jgi:hypothetical protein